MDTGDENVTGDNNEFENIGTHGIGKEASISDSNKQISSQPLKQQPETKAHFSDLLELSEHKDRMEGQIMDMIISDPGNAANVLSDFIKYSYKPVISMSKRG